MATRKTKTAVQTDDTFEGRVAQAAELLNSLQDEANTQIGLYQNSITEKNVEIMELERKIASIRSTLKIQSVSAPMPQSISNKQAALAKMEDFVQKAHDNLNEATSIADEWNFTFTWDLGYGMSGDYNGKDADWESSSSTC